VAYTTPELADQDMYKDAVLMGWGAQNPLETYLLYHRDNMGRDYSTMLDPITQAQIWHVIMDFAKENGVGVLAISHNKYLLERICTRIINLERIDRND